MNFKQIGALIVIVALVINLTLLVIGAISVTFFWTVIVIAAGIAYYPQIKDRLRK